MNIFEIIKKYSLKKGPRTVILEITKRCNGTCPFCFLEQQQSADLNTLDYVKIFNDPLLKSLDLVKITGGEPFLRNDLLNIVRDLSLNNKPGVIQITTNGSFPNKVIELVEGVSKFNQKIRLSISLDYINEEHDRLRGIKGLYKKVVKLLYQLKDLQKNNNVEIIINQTLFNDNSNTVDEIEGLAKKVNAAHWINAVSNYHESGFINNELKKIKYLDNKNESLILNMLQKKTSATLFNYPKTISIYTILFSLCSKYIWDYRIQRQNEVMIKKSLCTAMLLHCRITSSGYLKSCSGMNYISGELTENTFSTIWKSDKAKSVRESCLSCVECKVDCDVLLNGIYSGRVFTHNLFHLINKFPLNLYKANV